MALVLADRVNETTTTAGTGTLTLAGAVSGYQSFSVIGNANTTYYTIVHQTANEWEVGIGTYTSAGTTLSRDTVLASSAGGTTKVTFSAGTKFVFCDYPAGRAVYLDTASNATIPGITLSGGTANGVAYLNGSKVLTTGSALTFDGTNLGVGAAPSYAVDIRNAASTALRVGSNSNAFGSLLSWDNSSGTGRLWTLGAYDFVFGVNNTEQMRLTSTGLGIGTSSPGQKLTVQGGLNVTSSATLPVAQGSMLFSYESAVNRCYMGDGTGYSFAFSKRAASVTTDLMTLNDSGNLGIGTSSPNRRLEVAAGTTGPALRLTNTANNSGIEILTSATQYSWLLGAQYNVSGAFEITPSTAVGGTTFSTPTAVFTQAGNVGIGTTSPGDKLTVSAGRIRMDQDYQIVWQNAGTNRARVYGDSGSNIIFETGSSNTEGMRLNSTGLGIGTSSPGYKLDVNGAIKANGDGSGVGLYVNTSAIRYIINADNYIDYSFGGATGGLQFRRGASVAPVVTMGSGGNVTIYAPSSGDALTVNGVTVSGDATSTSGSRILGGRYTSGSLTTLGSEYSSGGPVLGYGVWPSAAAEASFVSATTVNVARGAYLQTGSVHTWWGGPAQTVAVGSAVTISELMRLDSAGNLGIGTTTIGERLVVQGAGKFTTNATNFNAGQEGALIDFVPSTYVRIGHVNGASGSAKPVVFMTAGNEVARFTGAGNFGIGTSSPGYKLTVNGDASAVNLLQVTGTSGASQGILKAQAGSGATLGFNRSRVDLLSQAGTAGWSIYNYGDGGDLFAIAIYGGSDAFNITQAGNVGIGTSSPDTKLTVTVADAVNAARFKAATGTVRLRPYVDATSGAILDSTNAAESAYLPLTLTGSTLRLFGNNGTGATVDSSGNLGLGVTPSAWDTTASRALQLNGGSLWGYSTSQINLMQNAYYNTAGNFVYVNTAAASGYRQISGTHRWITAASGTAGTTATFTTSMLIDGNGFLGIGTTSPAYRLHVSNGGAAGVEIDATGGINSGAFLQCYNRSTSVYVPFTTYASEIYWSISGAEKMRLNSSGNLLIGITSASAYETNSRLHLYSPTGTAQIFNQLQLTNAGTPNDGDVVGIGFAAGETTQYGVKGSIGFVRTDTYGRGALTFYTNNTAGTASVSTSDERARIDSSGNLLVGTTTNSGTLTVKGNQYNASSIRVLANGNVALDVLNESGTEVGYIQVNGAGTGTIYATSSDQRLKENIVDAADAGSFIDAIKVRQFDWISSGTHEDYGLIAQELMQVRPDAVSHGQTEESMKAIDYPKLVPLLIKEIQSLRQRVAQLEVK